MKKWVDENKTDGSGVTSKDGCLHIDSECSCMLRLFLSQRSSGIFIQAKNKKTLI
jgi:hypothetical protein